MGNPKFIPTQKKVTYSFRVEENNLNKLKQISELNDMKLPKLMSQIIDEYLIGKVVYNNYLEDFEGMFIDLPDITKGRGYDDIRGDFFFSDLTFEYEIQAIPNNLDSWDSKWETYNSNSPHYSHEGIEFLIVPEICEYENRQYYDLTKYLYCIYFTVPKNSSNVEIDYIPFVQAINRLKQSENYVLLNHALNLKETLEERTNEVEAQIFRLSQQGAEFEDFEIIWTELNRIAKKFNTGNIIPIGKSRKDIKDKAKLQTMTNLERETLLKENKEMKKQLKKMESILERLDKLEEQNKDFEFKLLENVHEEKVEKPE